MEKSPMFYAVLVTTSGYKVVFASRTRSRVASIAQFYLSKFRSASVVIRNGATGLRYSPNEIMRME